MHTFFRVIRGNTVFLAVLLIGLAGCDRISSATRTSARTLKSTYTITRIADGDTVTVSDGTSQKKIRFCGIDAPEKSQPLGAESKATLEKLLKGVDAQNVQIDEVERDRYGRSVSEVFIAHESEADSDKFVNAEMVRAGMAYVYRQYLKSCPNASALELAEEEAKRSRRGVWSGNYQTPWDYRRSRR